MVGDYFRKKAKQLLRAQKADDASAHARAAAVLHHYDPERFTHMTALHVVAVEAGFKSWSDLVNAPEDDVRRAVERDRGSR